MHAFFAKFSFFGIILALLPVFFGYCQVFFAAEQVMKAYAAAFPDVISRAVYRDGDWAVLLRGKWFYYAEGRLLPENIRKETENQTE